MYVRTEASPSGPEHVLALVWARALHLKRVPVGEPLPELELAYDPDATARADRVERALADALAERDALAEALRAAVHVVPVTTANDLRRIYREALA